MGFISQSDICNGDFWRYKGARFRVWFPLMVWPISGTGWVINLIFLLTSVLTTHGVGATGPDTRWRCPQHGCKVMSHGKHHLCAQPVWKTMAGMRTLCRTPFSGAQTVGSGPWMEVLVHGWGDFQTPWKIVLDLGILVKSVFYLCYKERKSKKLGWGPVTMEGDGQIYLFYISVLSTTKIIKTAEKFSVGNTERYLLAIRLRDQVQTVLGSHF